MDKTNFLLIPIPHSKHPLLYSISVSLIISKEEGDFIKNYVFINNAEASN